MSTRGREGRASTRPACDERGSGTMIMIGVVVVVLVLAWAATIIGGYLLAGHRAKSAADLAAVSGASAVLRGEPGCPTARRIATRLRAAARCEQVGDTIDFVVTVHAMVSVPLTLPGLPTQVGATGHAGPAVNGAENGATASPAR